MSVVNSWSYSALAQYELCPAQYRYQRIEKRPTAPKPYFEKGNRVHKSLENHVLTHGASPLDKDVKKELAFVAELAALPAHKAVEQKWGFTKGWRPASWNVAYFRAVLDVLVDYGDGVAEVVDWKTGGKYGSNQDQMELFAVTTMNRLAHVRGVTTRLVYVDAGGQDITDFSRSQLAPLTAKWENRAAKLFAETEWRPKPNERCGLCDFAKSKGGPCRYG